MASKLISDAESSNSYLNFKKALHDLAVVSRIIHFRRREVVSSWFLESLDVLRTLIGEKLQMD